MSYYDCLEAILDNPYSSSLWEITRLLTEISPQTFEVILNNVDSLGFSDISRKYRFTIGDKNKDNELIKTFERLKSEYTTEVENSRCRDERSELSIVIKFYDFITKIYKFQKIKII